MKLKDYFRTKLFILKNRKKGLIASKGTLIKRSELCGKNLFGKNNNITNSCIGYGTYFGKNNELNLLKIGNYCSIGSNLKIIIGSHPIKDNVSTHPAFFINKYESFNKIGLSYVKNNKYNDIKLIEEHWNLIIGNDVWIGDGVSIFQGVKIGDGAVIGTGAIVTKNVEPYAIVGGVPAKLIRKRFNDEDITFLLGFKWWEKEENWIQENAEFFEDVELLKKAIGKNEKEK